MRNLHYAGEFLTIDTDICTAVFEYAKALANAQRSDVVQVPIFIDGKREFSNMLLGPATLLFCTPASDVDVDMTDPGLLARLKQLTDGLGPVRGSAISMSPRSPHDPNDYSY